MNFYDLIPVIAAILISQLSAFSSGITINDSAIPTLPQSARLSDDLIDGAGERVMNGHDFRSVRHRVLDRTQAIDVDKGFLWSALGWMGDRIGDVFNAIGDFFRWLFSGFGSSGPPAPASTAPQVPGSGPNPAAGMLGLAELLRILALVAILAVLVVIISMIVRSVDLKTQRNRNALTEGGEFLSELMTPPGDLAASTYESRAIQLAADGNYRGAIRELLLGSMSWVERAGMIRYRKGLTNRDYARAVWRRPDKRDAYLTTATQFEFVFFGRRMPTAEMFELCLTNFRGAFREEETPTAAV
jgi:hypothetical protein